MEYHATTSTGQLRVDLRVAHGAVKRAIMELDPSPTLNGVGYFDANAHAQAQARIAQALRGGQPTGGFAAKRAARQPAAGGGGV